MSGYLPYYPLNRDSGNDKSHIDVSRHRFLV